MMPTQSRSSVSSILATVCCASSVALLATSAQAQTVAYYRFENGTANTAATAANSILDSSGNGFNGTPFLSPTYQTVPVAGTTLGLDFTGGAQRVFIPDYPALALTQSLTLEALIRYDGTSSNSQFQNQILFRGDDRGGFDPYYLSIDPTNNKLNFQIASLTQAINIESPAVIPTGQYVSVAGTLDNGTGLMRLYVNGSLVASQTTTIRPLGTLDNTQTPGLGIGNVESASYFEGFNGVIDEARISNVALQPGQFVFNAATPEPGSIALLTLSGLPVVGMIVRRRSKGV